MLLGEENGIGESGIGQGYEYLLRVTIERENGEDAKQFSII